MFIGPSQSNNYTPPINLGINLAKIDFVSAWHLKERSQVLETRSQDIRNTFQMQTVCISIPGQGRGKLWINVSHTVITQISFGKGT